MTPAEERSEAGRIRGQLIKAAAILAREWRSIPGEADGETTRRMAIRTRQIADRIPERIPDG